MKKKGKITFLKNFQFFSTPFLNSYIAPDNNDDEEQQRTVDLNQSEIKSSVDIFSAQKRFDLELPLYGPYHIDYTRNGRYK